MKELLPLLCFSIIFYYLFYLKNRRKQFNTYLNEFRDRKMIAKDEYSLYYNRYNSIFNFLNIHELPEKDEIMPNQECTDYERFLQRSNAKGQFLKWVVMIDLLLLFSLIFIY